MSFHLAVLGVLPLLFAWHEILSIVNYSETIIILSKLNYGHEIDCDDGIVERIEPSEFWKQ